MARDEADTTLILFYSKHSNACNTLFQMIDRVPILKKILSPICVDNEELRERIFSSKNFSFKKVPCIVKVNGNGEVELFEGVKSFQMISAYLAKQEEQRKLALQQQEMINLKNQLELQKQMIQKLQKSPGEVKDESKSKMPSTSSSSVSTTSISDLIGDDETTGIGTYVHVPKNNTPIMEERGIMPDRAIKKVESQKTNSISNIAAQMAKERETINSPPGALAMSNPRIP